MHQPGFDSAQGQTFQNVQYPGIQTVAGFITSTALIVLLVAALYVGFKRRDWL